MIESDDSDVEHEKEKEEEEEEKKIESDSDSDDVEAALKEIDEEEKGLIGNGIEGKRSLSFKIDRFHLEHINTKNSSYF